MKYRLPILVGVCFLSLAVMANAGDDNAKKIVGVWEPAKGGGTIEFTKDGKLKIVFNAGDKTIKIDGTYKVTGADISVTLEFEGKTKMDTAKIKSLTDKELQLDKGDGSKIEVFKRKAK